MAAAMSLFAGLATGSGWSCWCLSSASRRCDDIVSSALRNHLRPGHFPRGRLAAWICGSYLAFGLAGEMLLWALIILPALVQAAIGWVVLRGRRVIDGTDGTLGQPLR